MNKIILPAEYPYLFETHLHTCSGSACASCSPVEIAKAHKLAGYSGIIITEHNWGGNTSVNRRLKWTDWVYEFTCGYEEAYAWGKKNNLVVLWGYEAAFDGTEFLIYGLKPDFFLKFPEIRYASIEEQYKIVHAAGGIVVHAHPFREAFYIPETRLYPRHVDAVEGINAAHFNRFSTLNDYGPCPDREMYNRRAIEYANEHDLPITAGSDTHSSYPNGGGMAFNIRPENGKDFTDMLLSRKGYLLTEGVRWYSPAGKITAEVSMENTADIRRRNP